MEQQEIVVEFLIESAENLARFEQEMVALEQRPDDPGLLASIFRTIHTIKGTCGFLGFSRLQSLSHVTEDLLGEVRDGKRSLDQILTSLILESVDAIKRILEAIEQTGAEGDVFELDLIARLERTRDRVASQPPPVPQSSAAGPGSDGENPIAKAGSVTDTTLRVDVGLLDRLMNLVGELVLTRNQVLQHAAFRDDAVLNAVSQRLNLITSELQGSVMKTRMQPIGVVWNKLPRLVRDISTRLGKDILVDMDGAGTELDRTIIEAIKDPLIHIVRNSCDHGIEKPAERIAAGKSARGRLSLRAFHEGGQVNIEVADDGGGIEPKRVKQKAVERGLLTSEQSQRLSDREAVNLVFLPGFSTAQNVTNISGRGVGMDVVKTHIERIGGTVDLVSTPGDGTTVRVKIPLTLAIIPGLVVNCGGERFVIPQISLHELIRLEGEAAQTRIERVHSAPVYRRRDGLLPLVDLSSILALPSRRSSEEINIVVVQADEHRFGVIVDSISDSQEIVVKPLGQQLKSLNCYAGATMMGDGKIALILDIAGIGIRSGVIASAADTARAAAIRASDEHAGRDPRRTLLLFRAGRHERIALPLSEVARLEKIPLRRVEHAAGEQVVQYRDRILPLLCLAEALGSVAELPQDELNVIVYSGSAGTVGLVVDEITDIIEETVASPRGSELHGVLGSAVVGGQVTDFLDIDAVLRSAAVPSSESLARLQAVLATEAEMREEVLR